ncbi:MAG: hypothetical protein ACI9MC_003534 [Kiritimatiellia bacterium]|jgi:hypothetical protein
MYRFVIALIILSIPLAATPALACGMPSDDLEPEVTLADLMSAIDGLQTEAIDAAQRAMDTVAAQVAKVDPPQPTPPVEPST